MRYPVLLIFLMSVIGVGCSSSAKRPDTEIAKAESSIKLAEQNGAQQHSMASLTKARQKLIQANDEVADGQFQSATRLANEAEVDARLAAAQALLKKNKITAEEIDSGLKALESEVNRGN